MGGIFFKACSSVFCGGGGRGRGGFGVKLVFLSSFKPHLHEVLYCLFSVLFLVCSCVFFGGVCFFTPVYSVLVCLFVWFFVLFLFPFSFFFHFFLLRVFLSFFLLFFSFLFFYFFFFLFLFVGFQFLFCFSFLVRLGRVTNYFLLFFVF